MKTWFVTVKDQHTNANPDMWAYMAVVSDMLKTFRSSLVYKYCLEKDSRNVLHIHMLVKGNNIHFKTLQKRNPQFCIHQIEIKNDFNYQSNCKRIENYMDKENLCPDECQQVNWLRERDIGYLFI